MPTKEKGERRESAEVRTSESEDDDFLFGSCSVVTSTYLVLLAFVALSALVFAYLYQQYPLTLTLVPVPIFVVICTALAMCLHSHRLMYPIIIAKFIIFLVLFVCLVGNAFLALTMSYSVLRSSLFAIDDKDVLCKAARLVTLVNTIFWLFVFVAAVSWELGVLVVCKEFYKSKRGVFPRAEKHKTLLAGKLSPSSLTPVAL